MTDAVSMPRPNVLEMRGLNVSFPGLSETVHAVGGCSLGIAQGEVLGLVGESGSGKSMLASACLGLIPPPGRVSGSILVDGEQVVGKSDQDLTSLRGGGAAMIFQNPSTALNPFFRIEEQMLNIVARHRGVNEKAARDEILDAFEEVRLPDPTVVLMKYPHQLSGGQLQRVMIALALACRPRLLIADEPTTALDVTIQAQIILLLRRLVKDTNLAVLFITHDLGVVASLCDRVAVMYAGKIVESGSAMRVLKTPSHPYTGQLLKAVPRIGLRGGGTRSRLAAIPGQVPNLAHLPPGCAFRARCSHASDICAVTEPELRTLGHGGMLACHNGLNLDAPKREATG